MDSYLPAAGDIKNANLYVYVGGNPLNLIDPSGHEGSLGEVLMTVGLIMNIVDLSFHIKGVVSHYMKGEIPQMRRDALFALGDLAFLALPGAGPIIGGGGAAVLSTSEVGVGAIRTGWGIFSTVEDPPELDLPTLNQEGEAGGTSAEEVPELGNKLDYPLGKATGSAHNIQRSTDMLHQLESIGLPDSPATRQLLRDHLTKVLNDPSDIALMQENGRTVRESLLMGPRGAVKLGTVWDGKKLITIEIFGGNL